MSVNLDHPTVLVDGVPIDVEIAPLIKSLWERGIETLNSCQDNGGKTTLCGSNSPLRLMRASF